MKIDSDLGPISGLSGTNQILSFNQLIVIPSQEIKSKLPPTYIPIMSLCLQLYYWFPHLFWFFCIYYDSSHTTLLESTSETKSINLIPQMLLLCSSASHFPSTTTLPPRRLSDVQRKRLIISSSFCRFSVLMYKAIQRTKSPKNVSFKKISNFSTKLATQSANSLEPSRVGK